MEGEELDRSRVVLPLSLEGGEEERGGGLIWGDEPVRVRDVGCAGLEVSGK
jgi:hypothetical protein